MNDYTNKVVIIGYVVSSLSIVLTYICGRFQSMTERKLEAYKEAYETLYLPLISLLYETQIWNIGFSNLDINVQDKISGLITDNIQYMDPSSLEWIDIFLGHRVSSKKNIGYLTPARLDEVFDSLTLALLNRATWLARKLHQPKLGTHVSNLYIESQQERRPTTTSKM